MYRALVCGLAAALVIGLLPSPSEANPKGFVGAMPARNPGLNTNGMNLSRRELGQISRLVSPAVKGLKPGFKNATVTLTSIESANAGFAGIQGMKVRGTVIPKVGPGGKPLGGGTFEVFISKPLVPNSNKLPFRLNGAPQLKEYLRGLKL